MHLPAQKAQTLKSYCLLLNCFINIWCTSVNHFPVWFGVAGAALPVTDDNPAHLNSGHKSTVTLNQEDMSVIISKETRKTSGTASKSGSGQAMLWFLPRQEAAYAGQARGLCGLISISLSQRWPKVVFAG